MDLSNENPEPIDVADSENDDTTTPVVDFQSFVREKDELLNLVHQVGDLSNVESDENVKAMESRLDKYQEQPQLLDPHLDALISGLMKACRTYVAEKRPVDFRGARIFRIIYWFTKVRGTRFFPHEVADLERTFAYLEALNHDATVTWEARFVLLLWLAIIVLIPFALKIVDSSEDATLASKMHAVAKNYLNDTGVIQNAAAMLISTLLTRPDTASELKQFLEWSKGVLADPTAATSLVSGVYHSLIGIFQRGDRDRLLECVQIVFDASMKPSKSSMTNKKLSLKLIQRISMVLLKPRNPKWKYTKRNFSLLDNLSGSAGNSNISNQEEEDEDYDIPDRIEDIIDALLSGLRQKETSVRWTAAKGVGRLTNRLPLELADEVVGAVFDLFSPKESDSAWHGACLAVAELARRGLLLPARLAALIPKIVDALQYEIKRTTFTIGHHVRDAACYVCWAIARAYDQEVLQQHVTINLASSLLITALFDREVNCRRAAAAAFQENVGRQGGTFPRGIDVIVNVKVPHVDQSLREVASLSLAKLTPFDPKFMIDSVLPKLIPSAAHPSDVCLRHGALLAVAEIVGALGALNKADPSVSIPIDLQHKIREIEPTIERLRLYRGKGAELIRVAVCLLIQRISEANIPLRLSEQETVERTALLGKPAPGRIPVPAAKVKPLLNGYLETLEEDLKHPRDFVQEAAVAALRALCLNYFETPTDQARARTVDKYIVLVKSDPNVAVRRGYTLALGSLHKGLLGPKLKEVVDTLIEASKIPENPDLRDPETRRNAIQALSEIAHHIGFDESQPSALQKSDAVKILDCILRGFEDYSLDNRGDIGSWVREASIKAAEAVVIQLAELDAARVTQTDESKWLSDGHLKLVVERLVRQSVEKIDKMRDLAGSALERLVRSTNPPLPALPRRSDLLVLLDRSDPINWASASSTFPLLINLLSMDEYARPVLTGISRSIGGKSNNKDLVDHSTSAFVTYLKEISSSSESTTRFGRIILDVFDENINNDIVTAPLQKTVELVFGSLGAEMFRSMEFGRALLNAVKKEMKQSKGLDKILASIPVFSQLVGFGDAIQSQSLSMLMFFLSYKYPVVRKSAGENLYIAIQQHANAVALSSTARSELEQILLSGKWDGPLEPLDEARDRIYDLLGLRKPVTVIKQAPDSPMKVGLLEPAQVSPHTDAYAAPTIEAQSQSAAEDDVEI